MPSGSGVGTESYTWDTESEWQNGTFTTNTTTDGSGSLIVDLSGSHTFTYSIDSGSLNTNRARVEVRDNSDGTQLYSATVYGDNTDTTDSGEFVVDTSQHPEIELYADAESNGDGSSLYEATADITDESGNGASAQSFNDGSVTDTYTEFYGVQTGDYETGDYTFSETTTATHLSTTSTFNDASESITITVTAGDGSTSAHTLSGGSESFPVSITPSTTYYLAVSFDAGDDASDTPSLDSTTLEMHTQPDGLSLANTIGDSTDIDFTPVSVADAHEIYRAESTPVSESDTFVGETNTPPITDSGLENGETYHYVVRAEYTGE